MMLEINGERREFLGPGVHTIAGLVAHLQLKQDRIAVEHNGALAPRSSWAEAGLQDGDKLEIVHFVGGGTAT